jgi:hypothetical protein
MDAVLLRGVDLRGEEGVQRLTVHHRRVDNLAGLKGFASAPTAPSLPTNSIRHWSAPQWSSTEP